MYFFVIIATVGLIFKLEINDNDFNSIIFTKQVFLLIILTSS